MTSREIIVKPRTEGSREEKAFGQPENTEWERRGANYIKPRSGKDAVFEGYGFEDSIVYLDIYPQCKNFILREVRATVSEAEKQSV